VSTKKTAESLFVPIKENSFRFSCHRELPCFTACCAKLRLVLTPYDILRLKNRLAVSSDAFLDLHTETIFDEGKRFPLVRLRMRDDESGKCPFLKEQGCSVYEDRPGACRLYPVGRASSLVKDEAGVREKFFLVREPHCLGFNEDKTWTVDEWTAHEGLKDYQRYNDRWLAIVTSRDPIGAEDQAARKYQMFFMASYNLDRFRSFLFSSRFFERFKVDDSLKERMKKDDEVLLEFALDWLDFSLFGKKKPSIFVHL
jgi:Fe-S-cluster containining protein